VAGYAPGSTRCCRAGATLGTALVPRLGAMWAPDDVDRGAAWAGRGPGWGPGGPPWPARVVAALVLATVQVAGTVGAAHGQPGTRGIDALAVALLLAAPAGLLLARRLPWVAAVATGLATAAFLAVGYPFGPVFLGLAVVLVVTVARGLRLLAWGIAGVVVATVAASRLVDDRAVNWLGLGALTAWALLVLAVGEVVRVRRDRAQGFRQVAIERRRRQAGEERLRIAQELHDVVAHHLSLINVQAGVALHLADRRPENVEPALRAIRDASKDALTELRSLIDVLRDDDGPAPRAPTPTLARLDDIVERAGHAGLVVTRTVAGQERPLPAAVELAAYRIVQEAITNVVRHAHARSASVLLRYGDEVLDVVVEDDGRGGDELASLRHGNGLRGMHERAAALGGELGVTASPLGGLRVAAGLPVVGQR
jgi:signal transduction histidine kinase